MWEDSKEKNIMGILKKNETGLNFSKNKEQTLTHYQPYSTASKGFKRNTRFKQTEDNDWQVKEKRSPSIKPKLTRVVYRCNKPSDPLSNEIYKKHYEPFMTTTKYNIF